MHALILAATLATAAAAEPSPTRRDVPLQIADSANLLVNGVQAGWLMGIAFTVMPMQLSRDFGGYVELHQDLVARSRPVAPLLMPLAVVSSAVPVVMQWGQWTKPRFWLSAFSLLCNLGVTAAALAFLQPANAETAAWSPTQVAPAGWTQVRDRWTTGHLIQTALSSAAFVANVAVTVEL